MKRKDEVIFISVYEQQGIIHTVLFPAANDRVNKPAPCRLRDKAKCPDFAIQDGIRVEY